MTDIELLRKAARLMRERATAANPSPWLAVPWGKVADWLDAEASVHELCIAADIAVRAHTSNEFAVNALESTLPQAVAVANEYLGVES